jgi:hypothetical protein
VHGELAHAERDRGDARGGGDAGGHGPRRAPRHDRQRHRGDLAVRDADVAYGHAAAFGRERGQQRAMREHVDEPRDPAREPVDERQRPPREDGARLPVARDRQAVAHV